VNVNGCLVRRGRGAGGVRVVWGPVGGLTGAANCFFGGGGAGGGTTGEPRGAGLTLFA